MAQTFYDGVELLNIEYDGVELNEMYYDDVLVFSKGNEDDIYLIHFDINNLIGETISSITTNERSS